MELKIKNALKVFGFEDLGVIPKMKEIRKKWIKLSFIIHPDKPTGDTKAFQELIAAYDVLCDEANKMAYDKTDLEEEIARKIYHQFQSMSIKENLQTFTLLIEKSFIQSWETILTTNYGAPKNQQSSGQKFSFKDNCPDGGMIFLTLYHTGKILLQAEKNKHSINIHFVNYHLESLYKQVYIMNPQISMHGVKVPSSILMQRPVMKKSRSQSLSFQCKECDFVATSSKHVKDHIKGIHQPKDHIPQFQCKECDFVAKSTRQVRVHIENTHPPNQQNPQSLQQTKISQPFNEEPAVSQQETRNCPICHIVETNTVSLEIHLVTYHCPDIAAQCSVCDKRFSHMDNLKIHMITHHELETEPMTLEEAADVFDYEEAYLLTEETDKVKEPISSQNNTPKFDCDKCNNGFLSEDELQEHVKANHLTFEVLCEKCENTFDSKERLNEHMKNMHPQIFNCEKCDKLFSNQTEAEEHKTEHARYDALNTCQVCDTKVSEKELSIICDHCEFSYHKKCTELRKASGYWKPSQWKCLFC